MVPFDLYSIDYLRGGSARQQRAHAALREIDLLGRLTLIGGTELGEAPALVGSVPLDLALDESDIDLVAFSADLKSYANHLKEEFGRQENFRTSRGIVLGVPTLMASFNSSGESFEIFVQGTLVPRQNAVIHLMVEDRLLTLGGVDFRNRILRERELGMKTEEAFGKVLGVEDPLRELLTLEDLSDNELRIRFASALTR